MSRDRDAIRKHVRLMLEAYSSSPAAWLRERDFQAVLYAALSSELDAGRRPLSVKEVLAPSGKRSPHVYSGLSTNRVHAEIEIWDRNPRDEVATAIDVVVLRNDTAMRLVCENYGASDFWQRVCGRDVAAAIEIKASPSNYRPGNRKRGSPAKYAADLAKLANLKAKYPEIVAVFVLFDKAVQLPSAVSRRHADEWTSRTRTALLETPPKGDAFVEVWDLGESESGPAVVRHRYMPVRAKP